MVTWATPGASTLVLSNYATMFITPGDITVRISQKIEYLNCNLGLLFPYSFILNNIQKFLMIWYSPLLTRETLGPVSNVCENLRICKMNFAGQQTVCQIFDLHPKIPSFYRWTYSDLPICWMNKPFFHNLSNTSICFSYGMFCSRSSKHLRFLRDPLTYNQNTMLHSGDVCRWMNLI